MATAASSSKQPVCVPDNVTGDKVVHWKIHRRQLVNPSVSICELVDDASGRIDVRAPGYGWVTKMKDEGATVVPGCVLFNFLPCTHHVVMKDLCAECGANLRREGGISGERITDASASIPMVHAIPELHVSETVADEIALQDQQSLLAARKLVLLVDLDQTIIHTTNDPQAFKYKNVHRYRLPGSPLVYHTRLRPHLEKVLDCLSQYYQMHICTFGNRVYAHQLASMIDPKRRYFSQRILSRDECFNPVTKSANLKALFPRGLNLVCIIDDRGEVWDWSSNLIHVKPYRFFPDIGDINAFPWSSQSSPLSSSSIPTSSSFGSCTSTSTKVTGSSSSVLSNCSNVQLIDKSDENVNSQVSEVNENIISHDMETKSNNNDNTTTAINNTEKPVRCTVDKTNDNPSVTTTDNNDIEFCQTQSTNANVTLKSSKSTDNIVDHIDDNPITTTVVDNDDDEIQFTSKEKDNSDSLSKIKEIEIEMDAADDDYLLRLQEILLRIHRNYFKTYDLWQTGPYHHHHHHHHQMTKASENKYSDHSTNSSIVNNSRKNVCLTNLTGNTDVPVHLPHVSDIIAKLRKTVLGPNCHITLSGLSPAHFPADRCLAGRIVRSLGGILHASLRLPSICNQSNVDDNKNGDNTTSIPVNKLELKSESHGIAHSVSTHYTTHLIACRRGTEKVHAALKYLTINDNNLQLNNNSSSHSLHLVSPQWLWSCHYHWDHVCELKYPLDRDFHPSDFDPDIEPIPGTIRYAKRMRRHYYHHHSHINPSDGLRHHHHSTHNDNRPRHHRHGHSRHHHHRHSQHHAHLQDRHNHKHSHKHHRSSMEFEPSSDVNEDIEQKIPRLDPSVVRSALDSIRTERENDRKRKLRRKSKNERHHKRHRRDSSHHEDAKEKDISLIDNLTINDQGGLMFGNESSSSSSSPSLKSDSSIESDLDHHDRQPNNSSSPSSMEHSIKQETIISTENSKLARLFDESLCDHSEICQNNSIINCDLCKSNSLLLCNSDKLIMKSPIVIDPYVTEIKDEGDQDFNEYTTIGNLIELNDDKEEIEGTRNTEQFNEDDEDVNDDDGEEDELSDLTNEQNEGEEEVKAQLSDFLPPPTTLVLADNPLMHLPPDATGKMLAEIEDAVLEEVTERATSIPREAEIYDPAVDNFNDTSSTDSSSDHQTSVIELTKFHKSHITTNELPKNPMECDRRTLNWQVQRELLVRRRHRASPVETTKIDRKIRRLDQRFRRESRRRRSCDDLIYESMKSINSDNDNFFNESDSDCDSYDADYPKGWGPDEHVHKVSKHRFSSQKRWLIGSHHHKFSRLSVSPAIHSDPEPNINWWIQDTEDVENKEWNTCPEGYDYADAERTREIMYDSRRDRYKSCKYENNIAYQQRGHGNLTRCLFGADDNPEDINQSSADDEDAEDVIGPVSDISIGEDSGELDNDEDDDEEEEDEDLTDERWDPLREFM
ncbi:unnamed protein product [Schistosoma rodhaini]|uniref:protein-serine/threonine phosphatase n=1 Tax=Schistosoma rodhaini TaxID=6188 RepID=A0AA85ES18_9TREM|nr:unnamed protein product [Schistosoma rodhaini]